MFGSRSLLVWTVIGEERFSCFSKRGFFGGSTSPKSTLSYKDTKRSVQTMHADISSINNNTKLWPVLLIPNTYSQIKIRIWPKKCKAMTRVATLTVIFWGSGLIFLTGVTLDICHTCECAIVAKMIRVMLKNSITQIVKWLKQNIYSIPSQKVSSLPLSYSSLSWICYCHCYCWRTRNLRRTSSPV